MNACILCYGQTGSGKTHTMLGDAAGGMGIVPRMSEALFLAIAESSVGGARVFDVRCQFVEIYNDELFDIGAPDRRRLRLRADVIGGTGAFVTDATEVPVFSTAGITAVIAAGAVLRRTASTAMNEVGGGRRALRAGCVCFLGGRVGVTRPRVRPHPCPRAQRSSRSHAVASITVRCTDATAGVLTSAVLHMVDLAGRCRRAACRALLLA